ncbi:uncharacterized protein LOC143240283 [Tachypleus tridentatus]|uniref:uncharacterized protein LOC143240283 n=1 Tax=Tachypleus tridentatus TaxID=6853 RepID=UPI003FD2324E
MLPHNKRRFWCLPFLINFWMVFLQHCMADGKADVAVPRVRSHPENEKVDLWSSPISSDATDLYNVYLRSSFLDTLSPFSTHQVTFYQSSNSDDLSFEVEKVREMPASSRFSTSVIGVHDFGTGTNPDTKNSVLINHRDEEQTRYSQVERQVSFHHLDNFQFSSTLSIPWALRTIICLTCEQSRTFNSETIVGSKQEASFQVLRNNLYGSVAFSSSDSLRLNLETKYEFQIQSTSEIAYLADGSSVLSNVLSSNISDLLKATLSISPSPVDVGRFKTFEVSKGLVNELSSSNIVNLYTFNLPNETCRFSPIGSLTFVNLSPRLPHLTSCISDKDVEIKRPTLPINEESTQFTSSKRIHVFTEDISLMPHHSESVFSYSSAIYSSEMSDNGETVVQESHMFYTEQIPDTVVEISSDTFWRATYSRNLISDEDKYYILSPEQSSKRLALSTDLPAEIFTTNNVEANSAKTKFPKQMISSSFISSNDFSNHLHVWSNTAFIQQTLSVSLSEFENHRIFLPKLRSFIRFLLLLIQMN